MTKLKSPASKAAADSELIATIEEQSAELRLLRKEVAEWKKKYEKGELRDIAFTNSEKEVQPIYTPLDAAETDAEALGMPGSSRTREEFTRPDTVVVCGPCGSSPASEARPTPMSGTSFFSHMARPGFR